MFGPSGISPIQLLIVLALALLFFGGRGKVSALMADLAKGMRSFKKGLSDGNETAADDVTPAPAQSTAQVLPKEPLNVTPRKDSQQA